MRSLFNDFEKRFYFTIDLRTLALFRIGLSLLLIQDWITRFKAISLFYCDEGLVPLYGNFKWGGGEWFFSLFTYVQTEPQAQSLFIVGLIAYICLLLGFKTRIASVASWLFFFSLINRATIIRNGGDTVIVCFLFWSLFLPLGERFSIDSKPNKKRLNRSQPSLAALIIVGQLAMIYFATSYFKFGHEWISGEALFYAWSLKNYSNNYAAWLVSHLPLFVIHLLTWSALAVEWLMFFLILYPRFQPNLRRLGILLSTGLMIGIYLTMQLRTFNLMMIVANLLLLDEKDWRWIGIILNKMGIPIAQGEEPKPSTYFKKPSFGICVRELFLSYALTCFFISLYNCSLVDRFKWKYIQTNSFVNFLIYFQQTYQQWDMFAPNPTHTDGWIVFDGITESGKSVNPLTGDFVDLYRRPDRITMNAEYWYTYYARVWTEYNREYILHWSKKITRDYNKGKAPENRLREFKVYFIKEQYLPPRSFSKSRIFKYHLRTHQCLEKNTVEEIPSIISQ